MKEPTLKIKQNTQIVFHQDESMTRFFEPLQPLRVIRLGPLDGSGGLIGQAGLFIILRLDSFFF